MYYVVRKVILRLPEQTGLACLVMKHRVIAFVMTNPEIMRKMC